MKIHVIVHESFEAPGAIVDWAETHNCQVTYTRLYLGDIYPTSTDNFELLIVMGGPQSPATTLQESPHFDAQKEILFIKRAIDQGKGVVGICLGAQLIGEAMGARYEHSPQREIGLFEVVLTDEARNDPIFKSFPDKFNVGHWHGDMPGLTSDAKVLAKSDGCPRQVIRYASQVYALQCHFEFTPKTIEDMIENSVEELEVHKSEPYVQSPVELRANSYQLGNKLLFKFLDDINIINAPPAN